MALQFPPTPVPAIETTYICYGFTLPNDKDYHIIAMTPIINTSQILHHMLLYVCDDMKDGKYTIQVACSGFVRLVRLRADAPSKFVVPVSKLTGRTGFKLSPPLVVR